MTIAGNQARGGVSEAEPKYFDDIEVIARFWSKVDIRGAQECWSWNGYCRNGYGQMSVRDRQKKATRLSWEIKNRQFFPIAKDACHSCDNPICVNPAHIWPGTPSENMKDAFQKGRLKSPVPMFWLHNKVKTHCQKGHPFEGANLYVRPDGYRVCVTCDKDYKQQNKVRLREKRYAATARRKASGNDR